jgi:hypothetical protein
MRVPRSLRILPPLRLGAAPLLVGCGGGREPVVAGALPAAALVTFAPALAGPDLVLVPSAGRAADG